MFLIKLQIPPEIYPRESGGGSDILARLHFHDSRVMARSWKIT